MTSLPHYIVSDIHLGAVPRETERRLLRFLEHVGANASALLLPGDLFDFWFEYREVIPGAHFRTLAALAALVDAGVPVLMIGGNHDAWGGRFLREEVGVDFRNGVVRTTLAGEPALVAHGDGLGTGDFRYRMLKRAVRSAAVIRAFRMLHPDLGIRLARAVSRTDEKTEGNADARGRARFLSEWAAAQLSADSTLKYVVCGHAHVPSIETAGAGRFYINAGDWIHHGTYVTVEPGGAPQLHVWE